MEYFWQDPLTVRKMRSGIMILVSLTMLGTIGSQLLYRTHYTLAHLNNAPIIESAFFALLVIGVSYWHVYFFQARQKLEKTALIVPWVLFVVFILYGIFLTWNSESVLAVVYAIYIGMPLLAGLFFLLRGLARAYRTGSTKLFWRLAILPLIFLVLYNFFSAGEGFASHAVSNNILMIPRMQCWKILFIPGEFRAYAECKNLAEHRIYR